MGRNYPVDLHARVVRRGRSVAERGCGPPGYWRELCDQGSEAFPDVRIVGAGQAEAPAGTGKLVPCTALLIGVVEETPDNTMPELRERLLASHGIEVDPATLSRFLCRQGYTYKKGLDGGRARTRRRA